MRRFRRWLLIRLAFEAYMEGYREGFHGAEKALAEIASYNSAELREWGEDNAADMVEIAKGGSP